MQLNAHRTTRLGLALALALGLLPGCGAPTPPAQQPAGTAGTGTAAGTARLTIAAPKDANVENPANSWVSKQMEADTQVSIQWMELPAGEEDARTKITLMVSSNSELPDIIMMSLPEAMVRNLAQGGVLLDVTSYYSDPTVAPNLNDPALFPQDVKQFIMECVRQTDGKIYSLFSYGPKPWNEDSSRAWINKDWLAALGLARPVTTDDLVKVLRAFVREDPNGNGKADEIGMIGGTGWGQNPIPFLMNAFTYANPDKDYLHLENGILYAAYTRPQWREGLAFIHQLVQEGLLSSLSFTQDNEQLRAIGRSELALAGVITAGSQSTMAYEGPTAERIDLLGPITGPKGFVSAPRSPVIPWGTWWFTSHCKDLAAAFRTGDYLLSDEMSLATQYGQKEVHWTDDPNISGICQHLHRGVCHGQQTLGRI
jgi:putative aldouronate transport system substrate-binding protein